MYYPKLFMRKAAEMLPAGTRMVFSVPNLKQNLQQKMTSVINFEHTIFLTDDYIDLLLAQNGFEVVEKTLFGNHSIIYSTVQTGQNKKETDEALFKRLYRENKRVFLDYVRVHEERMERLNKLMAAETRPVYLFGGHITTQFYIAFGLKTDKIDCILDNDTSKHGKRVAGTDLHIEPPAMLRESNGAVVILPQSPYAAEIKQGIINQEGNRVEFWE